MVLVSVCKGSFAMQITSGFKARVEVLAHRHSQDWRIARRLTTQDYWLIAQTQIRRMGIRKDLISDAEFTERVRRQAAKDHTTRLHLCHGPTVDWDRAWLETLAAGYHLQDMLPWHERDRKRHAVAIYFVQARAVRQDLGDFVYKLQFALQRMNYDHFLKVLFCPVATQAGELFRNIEHTDANRPTIFVVDAELVQRSFDLAQLLKALNRSNIPWRCDSDFLSYCLRDIQPFMQCPLNWNWANFSGWDTQGVAYDLMADILAL
jgi:hypothetical protein